mmetsp:Transcript_12167/g.16710  ORF Transcript_12167/g.16710 Transcript_12167/m.16710 type:complete len:144 (-) Transcript_12167:843-1274(-)
MQSSQATFWMILGILLLVLLVIVISARIIYQRRMQAKLQEEVRNLLFEYVPMDDENEIETVHFADNFDFTGSKNNNDIKNSNSKDQISSKFVRDEDSNKFKRPGLTKMSLNGDVSDVENGNLRDSLLSPNRKVQLSSEEEQSV